MKHPQQQSNEVYTFPKIQRYCVFLADIRIEPSGLLEVRRNGEWGSVCDDYWTDRDADVACRQLGHLGYGAKQLAN